MTRTQHLVNLPAKERTARYAEAASASRPAEPDAERLVEQQRRRLEQRRKRAVRDNRPPETRRGGRRS